MCCSRYEQGGEPQKTAPSRKAAAESGEPGAVMGSATRAVLAGAGRGLPGGAEFGAKFREITDDQSVRARSGLGPAGDVAEAAGDWLYLDLVPREVPPCGIQVGSPGWGGRIL